MKKIKAIIFILVCIALGSIATPYHADDLGSSKTQGVVGFSPGKPPAPEPTAPTPPKGSVPESPKVNTKLPKTGEASTDSLSLSGFILLGGLTTLFIIDKNNPKRRTYK
ncbi:MULTISPECIES: LPXTG cell wall anchor domain-containing protein [Lactococcus]|uniref:LPXTG cell wall anchor domain-containing protein n=2 Tax=Lactococcus TaxID=1357 RepID=A0A387BJ75_9LACT|nr:MULTISPECIES: LPXTG cell wall anchor domain-containing protein [Lactococcus]AYG01097.1 LPXTG cell wall anchor domain-containing protein [Lactococcus allomyrinae]MCL2113029.1 LPXTG cell wall anchor domain-containing protein [Streptococcaceae bacterium]QDK70001.1 LPXTG cell wall anchor domain-containing protein [Lactococcus protaetiae]